MADNRREKKPSVAAFLFLPQFRLCLQGFGHIIPVFMRTLALMFEQAGLIAQNHPATRYGMPGVRGAGFAALMGEAWTTLKTTRATPYQWGLFSSVVFMACTALTAAILAVATVGFGLGAAAQAQLFSIPAGATDGTPISQGGSLPEAPAGMVFDNRVPCTEMTGPASVLYPDIPCTGTGHDDFAIMLLDKALRQGMHGVGGYLQNATRQLMEVYNSGVLVVAGIMLFWAVLSVVVDTAKTGTVGGGRHNMVWAPIRIVFALGIMIPLGSNGFSSGQYMVTKIAEWGSNLGTNAWQRYLGSIIGQAMVANMYTANPTDMVQAYSNMWLCRVAYNAAQWQAVNTGGGAGDIPASQLVRRVRTEGRRRLDPTWEFSFTNAATGNLCGTVTLPFALGDTSMIAAAMPGTEAGNFFAAQGIVVIGTDPIQDAIVRYKLKMMEAYTSLFIAPFGAGPGLLDAKARAWACDFAGQHIFGDDNPMEASGQCSGTLNDAVPAENVPDLPNSGSRGPCGGGLNTGNGPYPNADPTVTPYCVQDMVQIFSNTVQTAHNNAVAQLSSAIASHLNNVDRGWADMGRWFLQIGEINKAVRSMASSAPIQISGGDIVDRPMVNAANKIGVGGALGAIGVLSQQDITMLEIMNKANEWWKVQATQAARKPAASVASLPIGGHGSGVLQQVANTEVSGGSGVLGWVKNATALMSNPVSASIALIDMLLSTIPVSAPSWVLSLLQPSDPDLYPYTHVIQIGSAIFTAGWTLIKASAAITVAVSLTQVGGMPMITLVSGPLGSLLTTLGSTMMLAGAALQYWLPVLPFIRVAFSVLTWIVSVFEAVVMVPIAALAHITTEGEGLMGGAKQAWILWLNVLLRPVLTVIGYVGAILIFNSFVAFFHEGLRNAVVANYAKGLGIEGLFSAVATALIYVIVIYTVANSSFKMLDVIPNALMRWMSGQQDPSFDDHSAIGNFLGNYTGNVTTNMGRSITEGMGSIGKQLYEKGMEGRNKTTGVVEGGKPVTDNAPGNAGSGTRNASTGGGSGTGGAAASSAFGGGNQGMSGTGTASAKGPDSADQGGNLPTVQQVAPPSPTGSSGSGGMSGTGGAGTTGGGSQTGGSPIKPDPIIGIGGKKPPEDGGNKGGGGGGGGGSGPLFSDRRLKTDIRLMGQENGFDVYAFSYLGDARRFVGVIADEVLKTRPDAVSEIGGYLAVDYDAIGVRFRQIRK